MEEIVALAKIFSDPNRVKIAALLQREGGVCVCEICDTLSLSQPLVSRHLRQMRQAGVVNAEHSGKWMVYFLNSDAKDRTPKDTARSSAAGCLPQLPWTSEAE